jgi:hypothetical protein
MVDAQLQVTATTKSSYTLWHKCYSLRLQQEHKAKVSREIMLNYGGIDSSWPHNACLVTFPMRRATTPHPVRFPARDLLTKWIALSLWLRGCSVTVLSSIDDEAL